MNDASQPKSKQNRCGYCESVRHSRHSDCPDFLRDYAVNTRAASQQPPPPPANPFPERMDKDVPGEAGFRGYDSPRGGPSGNAGGSGGNLPPRGGNAGGGGDLGDSDSSSDGDSDASLPNPRKFLGRRKSHWNDARERKSMIGGVMSLLSIFGKNARVRGQHIDQRNLRNMLSIRSKVTLPILNASYRIAKSNWTTLGNPSARPGIKSVW